MLTPATALPLRCHCHRRYHRRCAAPPLPYMLPHHCLAAAAAATAAELPLTMLPPLRCRYAAAAALPPLLPKL